MTGFTLIRVTIATCAAAPVFAASTCESLSALRLQNTTVTLAETVAAGAFQSPSPAPKGKQPQSFRNLPTFWRVAATLTPVPDSEIKIEVWLPETGPDKGWYGNLQSVGNGARPLCPYPQVAVYNGLGRTDESANFSCKVQ